MTTSSRLRNWCASVYSVVLLAAMIWLTVGSANSAERVCAPVANGPRFAAGGGSGTAPQNPSGPKLTLPPPPTGKSS